MLFKLENIGLAGMGVEQGLNPSAWCWKEKPGFSLPHSLTHMTALPGGKNLPTGQAARAGGGEV